MGGNKIEWNFHIVHGLVWLWRIFLLITDGRDWCFKAMCMYILSVKWKFLRFYNVLVGKIVDYSFIGKRRSSYLWSCVKLCSIFSDITILLKNFWFKCFESEGTSEIKWKHKISKGQLCWFQYFGNIWKRKFSVWRKKFQFHSGKV